MNIQKTPYETLHIIYSNEFIDPTSFTSQVCEFKIEWNYPLSLPLKFTVCTNTRLIWVFLQ